MTYILNFEEYLRDKHAKQYIGLDDDMSDDYDRWVCDLYKEIRKKYKRDFEQLKQFNKLTIK